jgi:hypothetical protein
MSPTLFLPYTTISNFVSMVSTSSQSSHDQDPTRMAEMAQPAEQGYRRGLCKRMRSFSEKTGSVLEQM